MNGTLTVDKAMLTVTSDKAITYGAVKPKSFTPVYDGLMPGDTRNNALTGAPILTCDYDQGDDAGSYPITITAGTLASNNYSFDFVGGMLTVRQATLTVAANSFSIKYGDTKPASFPYEITGFVLDQDASLLGTMAPALSCNTYTQGADAADYPIVVKKGHSC